MSVWPLLRVRRALESLPWACRPATTAHWAVNTQNLDRAASPSAQVASFSSGPECSPPEPSTSEAATFLSRLSDGAVGGEPLVPKATCPGSNSFRLQPLQTEPPVISVPVGELSSVFSFWLFHPVLTVAVS